jgi:hypothetical protein
MPSRWNGASPIPAWRRSRRRHAAICLGERAPRYPAGRGPRHTLPLPGRQHLPIGVGGRPPPAGRAPTPCCWPGWRWKAPVRANAWPPCCGPTARAEAARNALRQRLFRLRKLAACDLVSGTQPRCIWPPAWCMTWTAPRPCWATCRPRMPRARCTGWPAAAAPSQAQARHADGRTHRNAGSRWRHRRRPAAGAAVAAGRTAV